MGRSSGYDPVGDPRTGRPPLPADRQLGKNVESSDADSAAEAAPRDDEAIEVVDSADPTLHTAGASPEGRKGFQAGQLVSLKSGGPVMTVGGTENGLVACQWFGDGDAIQTGVFDPEMLEAMEPDDEAEEGTGSLG